MKIICSIICCLVLFSCNNKPKKSSDEILHEAQENYEKQKAKDEKIKKEEKKDMVVQTASMAASFGLGMLIMWLILD